MKINIYLITVFSTMLCAPVFLTVLELIVFSSSEGLIQIFEKWFVFSAVGMRLFIAGCTQLVKPEFTIQKIFTILDPKSILLVRELSIQNLCMGLAGLLTLTLPVLRPGVICIAGLYFSMTGLLHIFCKRSHKNQHIAMISDICAAIILLLFFYSGNQKSELQKQLDTSVQSYIYAYPLVLMDTTKKIMTENGKYINRFITVPEFPTDTFKTIVRPNVDTLYSFAWLDLTQGPLLLSVPDTHDRYYLIEFLDAWTNVFASVGKRTTGTRAQQFIIVGPDDTSPLNMPPNFPVISAPTAMVLLLTRIQTYGKKDYANVHAIQAGYTLAPLHTTSNSCTHHPLPPLSIAAIKTNQLQVPVDVVASLDAATFYAAFTQALSDNPPAAADAPLIKKLAFNQLKKTTTESGKNRDLVDHSIQNAYKEIKAKKDSIKMVNGWAMMLDIGTYHTDYLTRALVAYMGIGANMPEDAIYPTAFVDTSKNPLNGKNKYRIHFDKGQIPPVHAFWSLTLYNAESFLVKNPLNRYSLNGTDPLLFNKDGSLDIYIQHESPGKDKESNWLPAPTTEFNLTMRLYWPKEEVLNGTWSPPGIEKIA